MNTILLLSASVLMVIVSCQQRPQSECEAWRQRELARTTPLVGGITPECEENGDFKPKQCHDNNWCQCWKRDGRPITQASRKIKRCECIRAQDDAGERGVGAHRPECHENGTYAPRQCWGSTGTCWCSDHSGNQLTEPVRNASIVC